MAQNWALSLLSMLAGGPQHRCDRMFVGAQFVVAKYRPKGAFQ